MSAASTWSIHVITYQCQYFLQNLENLVRIHCVCAGALENIVMYNDYWNLAKIVVGEEGCNEAVERFTNLPASAVRSLYSVISSFVSCHAILSRV